MFILLPPSEGKSPRPGETAFRHAAPDLAPDTEGVLAHLRAMKPADRPRFYGLRDPVKAGEAHRRTMQALDAPGIAALERYTGVVYTHIDYAALTRKAAARKQLLVVSALFGLIPGDSPIPDYKLSMNPWLARYWKDINTSRLAGLTKGKPVLDLLSQSYRQAVDYPALITVDFRVQGGKKAAGHFGKAIKGRFVRWILENRINDAGDFDGFTEDGYRFDGQNFIQGKAGRNPV